MKKVPLRHKLKWWAQGKREQLGVRIGSWIAGYDIGDTNA